MTLLSRLLAFGSVIAIYVVEPQRYPLYAFSLSLVHYALGLVFSSSLVASGLRHRRGQFGWLVLGAFVWAGIMFNTTLAFVTLFGVHHILTEVYHPLANGRPVPIVAYTRMAFHTAAYFSCCHFDIAVLGVERIFLHALTLSSFLIMAITIVKESEYRQGHRDWWQLFVFDLFVLGLALYCLTRLEGVDPRIPLLFGLYHVFFWIYAPLLSRGIREVGFQLGVNVALSIAVTLFLYNWAFSNPKNFQTLFMCYMVGAYVHACISLAISRLNPGWLVRWFHPLREKKSP